MKNFNQLSRAEMKSVLGGYTWTCNAINADGSAGFPVTLHSDNSCQAQADADSLAYADATTNLFPYGINCPYTCAD
jgi:natural product precursor